ncbi:uncharacterized protein LOC143222091 isoform X1 [Tachypleus tridentatus]|uniref:uncharacterized protein LOC143222091 isoform X1 n=1 Tax=Tachypleus tridentatus TaxID=6853 RepID=UPI003FD00B20
MVIGSYRYQWKAMAITTGAGREYMCPSCRKTFHNTNSLRCHHLKEHRTPTRFRCHLCGKGFKWNCYLRNHMIHCLTRFHWTGGPRMSWQNVAITTENGVQYKCPECRKLFRSTNTVRNHYFFQHKSPVVQKCFHCGKEFKRLIHLKRHAQNCYRL